MQKFLAIGFVVLVFVYFFLGLFDANRIFACSSPIITFSYGDKVWTYTATDNESENFYLQSKGQKFGRWGTGEERAQLLQKVKKLGFSAEESLIYTFVGIEPIIKDMKKKINRPFKNATMEFTPNSVKNFKFTKQEDGYELNFDAILNEIAEKLKFNSTVKIDLKPKILKPEVYLDDLTKFDNLKSSFYTTFNSNVQNRAHNIALATKCFNGLKIANGTEYSFNKITGRRSEENGYRPANIIVDKKYVEGYGGGVCQVSTTLYNALLLAGLEIKEVHSHSLTSGYINMGFDAMVNFGSSDLRWVNNTGCDMYLKTYTKGNQIHFEIYGQKDERNLTYKRVTEIEKTIEPQADEVIIDEKGEYSNLVVFNDESAYINAPKKGYTVRAILETYQNDKLIERKLLRRVSYQASKGIKVVGAKERPQPIDEVGSTEQTNSIICDIVEIWDNLM